MWVVQDNVYHGFMSCCIKNILSIASICKVLNFLSLCWSNKENTQRNNKKSWNAYTFNKYKHFSFTRCGNLNKITCVYIITICVRNI